MREDDLLRLANIILFRVRLFAGTPSLRAKILNAMPVLDVECRECLKTLKIDRTTP